VCVSLKVFFSPHPSMDHTKSGRLKHTHASSTIEGLAAGVVSIEDTGGALEK